MQVKSLTIPGLWISVKRQDIEIAQTSKFRESIGFGFDLSDTQDGLRCLYFVVNILSL